jgi:hemerythrin superfamily protein
MDAITFLLKEHDKVRKTFAEINDESHRDETKKEMFNALCQDLIRHETMEQKVWYPHFKNNEKLDDTVKHLITEEKSAANTIKEFEKIKTEPEWEEKFLKFKKDVEHHASEEEHKLFPVVKKILDEVELEKIGKEMQEFKKEFAGHE